MKKKHSKIFGVGLSLVLALALVLAGPLVVADVSEPAVTVDPDTIDTDADYTIIFNLGDELDVGDTITVRFPDDTTVPQGTLVEGTGNDFLISAGSGAYGGSWTPAEYDDVTATGDEDDLTVIFTLGTGDKIGSSATVVINFLTAGSQSITNPTEAGDYTLEVRTSEEDTWVESEVYEIDVPTVGGGVYVRNSADVLMDTFGGDSALNDAQDEGWFGAAYDDYTIEIGPGTYKLQGTDPDITIEGEGITIVSTDGAATTIIDADGNGFVIGVAEVTIDGFTIDDADTAVAIGAFDDVVIQNCVITDATVAGVAIASGGEDSVISDNVIEDCATGISFGTGASDVTVENNEITEANTNGAIYFTDNNDGNTISGNTISDNDVSGIVFAGTDGNVSDDNLIEGNTISGNDPHGIVVNSDAGDEPTGLVIMGNDITENDDDGINILRWGDTNVIVFNNLVDNGDDAIDNVDAVSGAIDAILNWWGTDDSDDIDAEFEDDDSNDDWDPFLTGAVDTIFTGYNTAAADDELDAEDEAGVEISGLIDDDDDVADRIKAGAYAANPEGEDPPDPAVAYYDVYVGYTAETGTTNVVGELVEADVTMLLKLHVSGINDDMVAYAWSITQDKWIECSDQAVSEYGGYVVVTIEDGTEPALDELSGTTFAVVQGEPGAAGVPDLESPDYGAEDVGLNPTFAWGTVEDADEYTLQVATNPFFVDASEKAMLTHTVWRWDIALDNDTTYYWRVQAIDDGGESDWAESVFTTEAAPVAPPAPPAVLYTCPTCGLSFDAPDELQDHWATVHVAPPAVPEPLPTTPAYIWVIIVVGAVLVVAVIVLIVRTRRIA